MSRDPRRIGRLLIALLVALAAGCSSQREPVTTYQSYSYSIDVADSLGVAPLNDDPEYLWANPGTSFIGADQRRRFGFVLGRVPCDAAAVRSRADELFEESRLAETSGVRTRQYSFGPGAIFTGSAAGHPSAVVVGCGTTMVTMLALGFTPAEAESILEGFRFRDPPGDPNEPPVAAPS